MTHVQIDGGTVTSRTITDSRGTRPIPYIVGQFRFFVCIIGDDGMEEGVWDGTNYQEALTVADERAAELGCKVVDLVV